jgi:hypothetical protein
MPENAHRPMLSQPELSLSQFFAIFLDISQDSLQKRRCANRLAGGRSTASRRWFSEDGEGFGPTFAAAMEGRAPGRGQR